jgi:hypothetical protein
MMFLLPRELVWNSSLRPDRKEVFLFKTYSGYIQIIVFHLRRVSLLTVPVIRALVFRLSLAQHWWRLLIDPYRPERVARKSTAMRGRSSTSMATRHTSRARGSVQWT